MRVAILGCGPAGLLATHAAIRLGHYVRIYSRPWKSEMFGAMYLHRAIPSITPNDPELTIQVIKTGVREGYAENVYGDAEHPVSWDLFESGPTPGWDLKRAYERLWNLYHHLVVDAEVNSRNALDFALRSDIAFTTVPLTHLCFADHRFEHQKIWVIHGPGDKLIKGVNDEDLMYYNGYTPDGKYGPRGFDWYRFSQINKYQSWEYSHKPAWPAWGSQKLSEGIKPISTDCDCNASLIRLGRFGKWEKGVLTHHAYEEAESALLAMR